MIASAIGRWRQLIPLAVSAAIAVPATWLAAGAGNAQHGSNEPSPLLASTAGQSHAQNQTPRARAEDLSQAFRAAARAVLPAVVVVKAPDEQACPHCGRIHRNGHRDEDLPAQGANETGGSFGDSLAVLGSGFLVDPSGLVVTNRHVVESTRTIVVQLADGRQFRVTRVKADPAADLAILKIDATTPLPAARLANSEAVEIGDWVLAIGCPMELEQTVSAGIISAKNRSFCPNHSIRMLQTDAAINPGSSGGPLVNLDGEVVGITTSIASEDGGYQGIGFAIPSSHAKELVARFPGATRSKQARAPQRRPLTE